MSQFDILGTDKVKLGLLTQGDPNSPWTIGVREWVLEMRCPFGGRVYLLQPAEAVALAQLLLSAVEARKMLERR